MSNAHPVDWMWGAAMYADSSAWYSLFGRTCAGNQLLGQSVLPSNIVSMAKLVLPNATVKLYGNYFGSLVSTVVGKSHNLNDRKWKQVLAAVEAGGQAALMISM